MIVPIVPSDEKYADISFRRSYERKGLILKETVDYIKKLISENEIIHRLENKIECMKKDIKNLSLRLQV